MNLECALTVSLNWQLYCPELTANGALKRFRRWIDINPVLHEQLGFSEGKRRTRSFTPSEVKLIVEILGEPEVVLPTSGNYAL